MNEVVGVDVINKVCLIPVVQDRLTSNMMAGIDHAA